VWLNDAESYAGGSIATGRVCEHRPLLHHSTKSFSTSVDSTEILCARTSNFNRATNSLSGTTLFLSLPLAPYFTLYSPCIFVQLINSHQQMHQNKFATDFFIKIFPQCRNAYWGNLLINKSVTNLFWCIFWCELINLAL
jgi:hypothetical protein